MIYQLRIYEIFEDTRTAFHARFREHAMRIMRSYGFDFVALWEAPGADPLEFVYLLRWPDESTKNQAWEAFMADQEWKDIKKKTGAQHGQFVGEILDRLLLPTDYTPALQ